MRKTEENLTVQIHFNLSYVSNSHPRSIFIRHFPFHCVHLLRYSFILLIHPHLNSFTHYIFLIQNLLVRSCHFFDFCLNTLPTSPFSLFLQHLFQLELCLKPSLFLTANIVFKYTPQLIGVCGVYYLNILTHALCSTVKLGF